MSVSLEALAMSGASNVECGMDIEEWERNDLEQYPPPHLLAGEEEEEENNRSWRIERGHEYGFPNSHLVSNQSKKEHEKEEHRVTLVSQEGEKSVDRAMQTRRLQRTGSIKI